MNGQSVKSRELARIVAKTNLIDHYKKTLGAKLIENQSLRELEDGSLKLEAGLYFIRSEYKACFNMLLALGFWLLAEAKQKI